ncbi:MAG: hypothetical protein WBK96_10950 [Candidatus Manganitrophaceae bacterium]
MMTWIPSAEAHTKGISLSRYGLVDVSWTANIVYGAFSNYSEGVNPIKLGDRQFEGLSVTSFDLALSQDCFILYANFPCKWALFTAFEQEGAAIEEAFLLFHKMPHYLQAKTGIFRVNFTKINQYHDHEWAFADPPLITTFFLGVDGLHNVGAELNWQPPTPVFSEFSLSLMRGPAGNRDRTFPARIDQVAGGNDANKFILLSRATTFFDLTLNSNMEIGASFAAGRNKSNTMDFTDPSFNPFGIAAGQDDRTLLYGFDFTYQWKPRPFDPYVRWTTEYLAGRRENPVFLSLDRSLPNRPITETIMGSDTIGGMYSELAYRFSYYWEVDGRVDYVGIPKGHEDRQTRYTASLRYYVNPVSRISLQFNHNNRSGNDRDYNAVYVQLNIGGGTVTPGMGKFYTLF